MPRPRPTTPAPRAPLTRRQRQILDFYASYAEEHGISPTLEEVAQSFGLNKVTIFGHVAELERKGLLRRARKGVSRGLQVVSDEGEAAQAPPLQILGTIAAGAPIEALEDPEPLDLAELAPADKRVYVLRVRGDSMIEDSIRDGDLVLVEHRSDPLEGQTVVAVLEGEEATLKRFHREPGGWIRLQPANAALEPLRVREDGVEIRGVVLGVVRRYGRG